jgi:hypothetical protein
MQETVVLRTTDLEESLVVLATTGALAPRLLQASWKAVENIRSISTKLPAYAPGSDPRNNGTPLQLKRQGSEVVACHETPCFSWTPQATAPIEYKQKLLREQ